MELFARRTAEIFCLAGALLVLCWTPAAFAQVAPTAQRTELLPPELLERVDAPYPEQARHERLEATVGLRLTIDVEGRVSEAEVIEAAGHGFDEAARQAGSAWDCPFPVEADDAGVDHAVVTLRVEVGADGHVVQASATRDPGHGFGREARRCALYKRWAPGLDREGRAASSVTVVNVRFER